MNKSHSLTLNGATLEARPSGALFWPAERILVVSDLHLGKSERQARRGGPLLPPYETGDTLLRLEAEIDATDPRQVICLGDSFDDLAAANAIGPRIAEWMARLQAGRRWTWIEGNHDPGPVGLPGSHRADLKIGPLVFRHIARPGARGEVSGHYHPKATLRGRRRRFTRPAFLFDALRLILPAFGTYTGGLPATAPVLRSLFAPSAWAVLTGETALAFPLPARAKSPPQAVR